MEFQTMTNNNSTEDDENSSNDETGTAPPDELRTYIIIVNDDGSLSLDPNGIIADDADPQSVFPVSLPVNKMKSPDCPLPGATPVPGSSSRTRKTKPQAVLYGGENDGVYELNPSDPNSFNQGKPEDYHDQMLPVNGTSTGMDEGTAGTAGVAPSIDIDQLGPQDIAILENVLQSESARELLENLALPPEEIPPPAPVISSHLWDHSYSTLSANIPTPPFVNLSQPSTTVVEPVNSSVETGAKPSKSIIKVSFSGSNPAKPASPVQPIPRVSPAPLSPATSTSPSLRRISEAEAAGNIRRSQRQQDRIERQEAERIMAENQQMMQREKELMMESSTPTPTVPPVVKPLEIPSLPTPTTSVPAAVSPRMPEKIMVTSPSIQPHSPTIGTPEDSPKADRRPTRQRKLPKHLADPNYVQFEDEAKPGIAETPKRSVEPEPKEDEVESMDEEADEEAVEDDDPNKLWCICRQPHNNRFMICCDKCDDWFHGKCVGITKAQAKKMETANLPWHCPNCRKIVKQEQQNASAAKSKIPARTSSRRGSETSPRGSVEAKVTKPVEVKQSSTPEQSVRRRDSVSKPLGRRKSASVSSQPEISGDESSTVSDCIECGKKSRKDSIFCSDGCISQRANATSKPKEKESPGSGTPPPIPPVPQSPAPHKLKRLSSVKSENEKEKAASIFDFHVIQAGATKSTEVVPAKHKEPTTALIKQSPSTTTPTSLPVEKNIPKTPTSPIKNIPAASVQSSKVASSSGVASASATKQITPKAPDRKDKVIPTPTKDKPGDSKMSTPKSSRSPTSSSDKGSSSKEKKKVGKESPKEADVKERDPKIAKENETLQKTIIRKAIRETLKIRMKDLSEEELALFPAENSPEVVAEKIEEELASLYGSTLNAKYKNKYRSIYFNLKDSKNFLFREILQGTLSPKNLVKMESSDMASAELAEWRNRENQKNLDMIKRAEIDKLVEAKKQALIDKGAEIDAVVAEEQGRKLEISDIIQTNEMSSENTGESDGGGGSSTSKTSGKSHSSSHHRKDKKHDKQSKDNKHKESKHSSSKDRDRRDSESSTSNKDRRSDRHRHRSKDQDALEKSKIKDKDTDSGSSRHKEKSKSGIKDNSREEIRKHRESKSGRDSDTIKEDSKTIKKSDSIEKTPQGDISEENSPSSASSQSYADSSSQNKVEDTKYGVRQSTDSEQELPSSTIKTPDFTEEKKEKGEAPVFRTKLMMHELGHFNASAYHVSHNSLQGVFFPESPVPIVGRISPETVWDYLDKMKKTKEVIVLRLAPETDVDKEGYMTFFTYLSSRGRLGVMGGITPPLKDVYLIPLDKHSPVNRALLPFRGPGLPADRTHCLLAVVTRHIVELPAVVQSKRKTSAASPDIAVPSFKKKRVAGGDQPQQSPSSSGSPAVVSAATKSVGEIPGTDATGALTDPRRKKNGSDPRVASNEENKDNEDDDDQPYTPWEEEDDKDPEVLDTTAKPVGLTAAEISAQKLLEEINRKIQQEKQEIESITSAIKMNENITHIPGLDGDFPVKETSSPVQGASVPFFLKNEPAVRMHAEPVLATTTGTGAGSCIAAEAMDTSAPGIDTSADVLRRGEPKISVISSDAAVEDKHPVDEEEDDQAYSPSAADFSDEDGSTAKISTSVVEDKTSKEDIENAAGLHKHENEKKDFIPGFDFPEREERETSLVASTPAAPELIELDDDEPPPPGEAPIASSKAIAKPTLDSVFSLPPPNYLSSKPKIQINLASKISIGGGTAPSVLPSLPPSTKFSPISSALPPGAAVASAETSPPQPQPSPTAFSGISIKSPSASGLALSSTQQQQCPSLASLSNSPIVPNIPPRGLVTMHAGVIPTNIPPPLTAMPPSNVLSPPGVITPVFPATPPQPITSSPQAAYHPVQRPSLIPAPPVGGVSISFSVPPKPTVGMVPVTSIPPLPTLRGMPSLTPRFTAPRNNTSVTSTNNDSPNYEPLGRFRPMGRFPQSNSQSSLLISPAAHSPPGPSRTVSFPAGSSGFADRSRRSFGHQSDKHDRNDGSEAQPKPNNNYSKGQDRYRTRPYGRHRSRSRSPVRNRSRSPVRNRSRSPVRNRSRSPVRNRSRSPVRNRSRSPVRNRSRSPVRNRSRSPVRNRSRSPIRNRSRSPSREKRRHGRYSSPSKSRSPSRSTSRRRSRSKSPPSSSRYSKSKSPARNISRSRSPSLSLKSRRRKSQSPTPPSAKSSSTTGGAKK